jgi:hypothetical protein
MLRRYWFFTNRGLGYGVTAHSESDALSLLEALGYPREGESIGRVASDIPIAELDANHVLSNAGPVTVRGVWFPCHNL